MVLALSMDKTCQQGKALTADNVITNISAVTNGPGGTVTATYKQAASLIKAGKPIQWQLSGSEGGFDKYHNVFGPFTIYTYTAGGDTKGVANFTSADLRAFAA
jgi:hypothetical protein